jgi:hypothetical protein
VNPQGLRLFRSQNEARYPKKNIALEQGFGFGFGGQLMPEEISENLFSTTQNYETWLAQHLEVIPSDFQLKHQLMASGPFPFMRGSFYRFVQQWPQLAGDLTHAPQVLAVGDIHVENFGTWRDLEGRLVWGINDFDEAAVLPYSFDLLRLMLSAALAIMENRLDISLERACGAILQGYQNGLGQGGTAFILEEKHGWLRQLTHSRQNPKRFWQKMNACTPLERPAPPQVLELLRRALPDTNPESHPKSHPVEFFHRVAGLGSLGRLRVLALTPHHGGLLAREAKALAPSAVNWLHPSSESQIHYSQIVARAIRSPDPTLQIITPQLAHGFVVRRLSPSSTRIDLADLPRVRKEHRLLEAMGFEIANIHLGTPDQIPSILQHIQHTKPKKWLERTHLLLETTLEDWKTWKTWKKGMHRLQD